MRKLLQQDGLAEWAATLPVGRPESVPPGASMATLLRKARGPHSKSACFQIRDIRSETSDPRHQIRDIRSETSDPRHQIRDIALRASEMRLRSHRVWARQVPRGETAWLTFGNSGVTEMLLNWVRT